MSEILKNDQDGPQIDVEASKTLQTGEPQDDSAFDVKSSIMEDMSRIEKFIKDNAQECLRTYEKDDINTTDEGRRKVRQIKNEYGK